VFHCLLSLYIVLIDVLIYSAAQQQECWINVLTYLHTSLSSDFDNSRNPDVAELGRTCPGWLYHCSLVCLYTMIAIICLGSSEDDKFSSIAFVIVGCITGLATCTAAALICYMLVNTKRQSSTAGLFLFSSSINSSSVEFVMAVVHFLRSLNKRLLYRNYTVFLSLA